jgi:hypothetical protein
MLEGICEYVQNGYTYCLAELQEIEKKASEFILQHKLFLSDRTGEIINKDFLRLAFPSRWRYDILRALDYFYRSGSQLDERMLPAIEVLLKKRKKDGTWPLQSYHSGQLHFKMEEAGKSSRWNTLRALRVLNHFEIA